MRRLPAIPTIVVALAVATMIALGVWQLRRAQWKDALVDRYAANAARAAIAFPTLAPVAPDAMFRRSSAFCLTVVGWRVEAGRAATGRTGYRQIAECRSGAEGPGVLIDMGLSTDPKVKPDWRGGAVTGVITTEPSHASLLGGLLGPQPVLRPMLVASTPAPGLIASARPTTEGISNNHRGYAVQWFIFALVATLIYVLALRRRQAARAA